MRIYLFVILLALEISNAENTFNTNDTLPQNATEKSEEGNETLIIRESRAHKRAVQSPAMKKKRNPIKNLKKPNKMRPNLNRRPPGAGKPWWQVRLKKNRVINPMEPPPMHIPFLRTPMFPPLDTPKRNPRPPRRKRPPFKTMTMMYPPEDMSTMMYPNVAPPLKYPSQYDMYQDYAGMPGMMDTYPGLNEMPPMKMPYKVKKPFYPGHGNPKKRPYEIMKPMPPNYPRGTRKWKTKPIRGRKFDNDPTTMSPEDYDSTEMTYAEVPFRGRDLNNVPTMMSPEDYDSTRMIDFPHEPLRGRKFHNIATKMSPEEYGSTDTTYQHVPFRGRKLDNIATKMSPEEYGSTDTTYQHVPFRGRRDVIHPATNMMPPADYDPEPTYKRLVRAKRKQWRRGRRDVIHPATNMMPPADYDPEPTYKMPVRAQRKKWRRGRKGFIHDGATSIMPPEFKPTKWVSVRALWKKWRRKRQAARGTMMAAGLYRTTSGLYNIGKVLYNPLSGKRQVARETMMAAGGYRTVANTEKTTKSKSSSKTTQSKPPSNTTQSKPPSNTTQSKLPSNTTQSTLPSNTTQSKPPSNTTQSKPPSNTTQSKPSSNTTQSKSPSNTTQSKPPSNTTQSKSPSNTTQLKPPSNTTQSKSTSNTTKSKLQKHLRRERMISLPSDDYQRVTDFSTSPMSTDDYNTAEQNENQEIEHQPRRHSRREGMISPQSIKGVTEFIPSPISTDDYNSTEQNENQEIEHQPRRRWRRHADLLYPLALREQNNKQKIKLQKTMLAYSTETYPEYRTNSTSYKPPMRTSNSEATIKEDHEEKPINFPTTVPSGYGLNESTMQYSGKPDWKGRTSQFDFSFPDVDFPPGVEEEQGSKPSSPFYQEETDSTINASPLTDDAGYDDKEPGFTSSEKTDESMGSVSFSEVQNYGPGVESLGRSHRETIQFEY